MHSVEAPEYTSSATLVILGEPLEPAVVSATLALECHQSWVKGQLKPVGAEVHQWGGWKSRQPEALKGATVEDQINFWLTELFEKAGSFKTLGQLGLTFSLDVFVSADAAWFKLSPEVIKRLAAVQLNIEFTFWASDRPA